MTECQVAFAPLSICPDGHNGHIPNSLSAKCNFSSPPNSYARTIGKNAPILSFKRGRLLTQYQPITRADPLSARYDSCNDPPVHGASLSDPMGKEARFDRRPAVRPVQLDQLAAEHP